MPWLTRLLEFVKRRETRLTLVYCLAFGALGYVLSGLGPSLPELGKRTGMKDKMGWVVTTRAIGYLVGSGSGPLFDRVSGNKIIGSSLILTSLACTAMTFVYNFWLLLVVVFFQGLSMGTLDTGGNVMILWLHQIHTEPYLQAAHATFGIGSFLSPLIINRTLTHPHTINISWWIISAGLVPVIVCLFIMDSPKNKIVKDGAPHKYSAKEKWIIFCTGVFLCLYVGAEVSAGTFIVTYLEGREISDPNEATLINFVFWLVFAIARVLSIPLSVYVSPKMMLLADMSISVILSGLFMIWSHSRTMIWVIMIGLGIAMASAFPSALNLAEKYTPISGMAATCIIIGSSFGEMFIPLLTSSLFSATNYKSYVYVLVGALLIGSIDLIVMIWIGSKIKRHEIHETFEYVPKDLTMDTEMVELDSSEEMVEIS